MPINHQATIIVVQWEGIKVLFMVQMAKISHQSTILIVRPFCPSWMSMPFHGFFKGLMAFVRGISSYLLLDEIVEIVEVAESS